MRLFLQSRALIGLIAAALGAMTTVLAAQAARPQSNEETTRALLQEVHALRVAMERLATTGPRVQLAYGRLQIQEQRITNLTTQLDTVRDRIRGDVVGSFKDELSAQERDLEQQIATEQARWSELNQRLDDVDHALAAPR
jgi:gas vesicle protein